MLAQPKKGGTAKGFSYHEEENYYQVGQESGVFYGKLANELGFEKLDRESLVNALEGNNAQGKQMVATRSDGRDKQGYRKNAYTDLTFTADKSISLAYEMALKSDPELAKKIATAHQKAVRATLDYIEKDYTYSRENTKAEEKALFLLYDHHESRMVDNKIDPSLHTHALMGNITQNADGTFNKLENSRIALDHKTLGLLYRNELALLLRESGLEIEVHDAKQGFIQTKGFSQNTREEFSQRNTQIKQWVEDNQERIKKEYPNITNKQLRDIAQKETRGWKDKELDLTTHKEQNKIRAEELDYQLPTHNHEFTQRVTAKEAIQIALNDITELKSVFSKKDLLDYTAKVSLGNVSLKELDQALQVVIKENLIQLNQNAFTTQEIIDKEQFIFSQIEKQSFRITDSIPLINQAIKEFEKEKGFTLKEAQNTLAHTILNTNHKYIIAQGVAGSGKSTSLEIVRNICDQTNRKIVALAPTGTATDNLKNEANIATFSTVAKFIQENGNGVKDAIVIIDEAGMMGLRDTERVIQIAERNNLKLVFSGDKNQKKSISQGDIFAGMQRQGFHTINLDEGNRQKNDLMKDAIKNILDKNIEKALALLKDTTREITNAGDRLQAAKEEYLKDRQNSLLITTTNADRRALNASIREELLQTGEIKKSQVFATRETPSMNGLEKRNAAHYRENQSLYVSKNIGKISAGREAVIKSVDLENNTITIAHQGKDEIFIEIVDLTKRGDSLNLYKDDKTQIGIGEQVIMKKNDKKLGLSNGQIGTVTAIKNGEITVKIKDKEVTFNTKQYPYIQHAYAITDFASQGKTTDKVIAVANSQSASFNDFYTQITRAKFEAHIITDNLKELQLRAARDSQKLNATDLISAQEKKETTMQQPTQPKQLKLTQEEFSQLSKRTKDELKLTDPASVLNALGIPYKEKNGRYEFKVRSDDKTASANMYIDKLGEWKYNDFGGNNGTIENLIIDTTKVSYKEALDYAIVHSGITDHVKERLDELNGTRTAIRTAADLSFKMQENLKRAEIHINSKVTSVKELKDYAPAVEYLASRGIHKIPPQFKMITGEYMAKDGTVKKAFGVGIESIGGGADIHFLKPLGNMKTMNFGEKNISLFESQTPTKAVIVFESKMDMATAYNQRDFTNTNIIIANSTSNAHKVAQEMIKGKYTHVTFYNQNDKPGIQFVKDVAKEAKITDFKYIKYQKHEQGQDINDLHKNGISIEQREEKSFMLKLKETYKEVHNLISHFKDAKEFYQDLTNIDKKDVLGTFDTLNNIKNNNFEVAKIAIRATMDAVKDVIKNKEISLSDVTKSIIKSIKEQTQEKGMER